RLFGIPPRRPESEISQVYMDMALAIQNVTENIVLRLARTAKELTASKNLVMAGGVALNCVSNGKILQERIFDDIWIQPAAGDAGGALGAAYAVWYIHQEKPRRASVDFDAMNGSLLRPEFSDKEILRTIERHSARARHYEDFSQLTSDMAARLN